MSAEGTPINAPITGSNVTRVESCIRPIFLLGRHRSGTTWLGNVIASFPEVFAPMHELHRGVHESAFFSHLVPYCHGGRTRNDLLAVKHLFERSDFFLLTGLDEGPDILQCGLAEYFRLVMNAAAARRHARYWLEKTPAHTLHAGLIARSYPDAVLLAVIRNPTDVVVSNVHGFGNPGSAWDWFRQAAITEIYDKVVSLSGAYIIRYEDLRDNYDLVIRRIAAKLGLKDDEMPVSAFERNSSHADGSPIVRKWQMFAMYCGRGLLRLCPARLVEMTVRRWCERRRSNLPAWFFLITSNSGTAAR